MSDKVTKTKKVIKTKTISTRVTKETSEKARLYLEKQGLTLSEYMRLSLAKAANDDVRLVSFLESPEALLAKKEVESGQTESIGSLSDFDDWLKKL